MKRFFQVFIFAVLFSAFFCIRTVTADEFFAETIPLEIALLYNKLTDTPPDLEVLAKQSPIYLGAPDLGKDIVLEDQKRRIEILFYAMSRTTPITVVDNFSVEVNKNGDSDFIIKEMDADLNYIYDIGGKSYIVFIRNYDTVRNLPGLKAQEKQDFSSMISRRIKTGAEIVLRPVTADIKPFDYKGEKMNMILADIASIRFIDNSKGDVIKQYEPIKEPPKQSKMDLFFREVVKQRRELWDRRGLGIQSQTEGMIN